MTSQPTQSLWDIAAEESNTIFIYIYIQNLNFTEFI